MAKDENGNLIYSPGTGPRCHINRRKLEEALDMAIVFHSNNQNDPHGIGNAVIAALSEVKAALVKSLS